MYKLLGLHFSTWLWLLWPLRFLMRVDVRPEDLNRVRVRELVGHRDVIYVLPRVYIVDVLVLNIVLARLRMPKVRVEARPNRFRGSALLGVRPKIGLFVGDTREAFSNELASVLREDRRVADGRLALMPVSIYWSRRPDRTDRNFILKSLFPDDGTANSLQKLFLMLVHSRNIHVHFGKPIVLPSSNALAGDPDSQTAAVQEASLPPQPTSFPPSPEAAPHTLPIGTAKSFASVELQAARRIRRSLLIDFNRERSATLGPALYDLSSVGSQILNSPDIERLVRSSDAPEKARRLAYGYLREIASNYNHATVAAFERGLDFVWTSVFRGVRVRNFEAVAEAAKSGQVLWIPCHRSHLDYLLLSYVLFKKGLVAPHIAAGKNLSFWPAGPLLRRSGAFFLRRSFAGNKLYANIFASYVQYLMHNSFPLMFFHEGGRSRIGKLLAPKVGLTSICVNSILKRKAENTIIIPVYFGYDKVMEDDSYARELHGQKKKNESIWQVIGAIPQLFSNHGRVDVVFGTPIHFGQVWQEFFQRRAAGSGSDSFPVSRMPLRMAELPDEIDSRDPQVGTFVRFLARRVNQGINSSATASATSLLAASLLAQGEAPVPAAVLRDRLSMIHWWMGRIAQYTGWSVATSASIDPDTVFLLSAVSHGEDGTSAPPKHKEGAESFPVVPSQFPVNASLDAAVDEALRLGEKWELLSHLDEAGAPAKDGPQVKRNALKETSLWWYRGTIFHLLAVPGLVAAAALDAEADELSLEFLTGRVAGVRGIWEEELFWPDGTSSAVIVQAGLKIFEELGALRLGPDGRVELSDEGNAREALQFAADLIRPERELYGMQLTAALSLSETNGDFTRQQLIQTALAAHRSAFLRGVAQTPSQLSQVYGARTTDALLRVGAFLPVENALLAVSVTEISDVGDFFCLSDWREFVP